MNHKKHEEEKGMDKYFFRASADDFKKIPSSPIAYWMSNAGFAIYESSITLGNKYKALTGMRTGDNERFLRRWHETPWKKIGLKLDKHEALRSDKKWFPYNKGGGFNKWYGNNELVVNWEDDGTEIKELTRKNYPQLGDNLGWKITNEHMYFEPGITWGGLTSSVVSFRWSDCGALFDSNKGAMLFPNAKEKFLFLGFLNSSVVKFVLNAINPTLSTQNSDINSLPILTENLASVLSKATNTVSDLISYSKCDENSFETSWGFTSLPLLQLDYRKPTLKVTYQKLRAHWREMTQAMQRMEESNNRIFIEAYGLQDGLMPEVPLKEITLTCNSHYRYSGNKSEEELEVLLLADTIKEFISYAVGCMFGRYALDKPGLILANQGETLKEYLSKIPEPTFPADDDNVIPMLDGDWFTDDITERFFKFLRVTFGEDHYAENLKFIEQAIGKDVRRYFLKDFHNDHVKRYKKRPIYWLFSSPKGSFNALIYMHRYRPDTVSVVLNDYLREFQAKLASRKTHLDAVSISGSSTQSEKIKALKEIEKLNKMIQEMEDYEREILYPLATEQVEIDLDDGVKVNYNKFGAALKKIAGLSAKG